MLAMVSFLLATVSCLLALKLSVSKQRLDLWNDCISNSSNDARHLVASLCIHLRFHRIAPCLSSADFVTGGEQHEVVDAFVIGGVVVA